MLGMKNCAAAAAFVLTGAVLLASCCAVRTFADLSPTAGAEAEECLIDFSKKIKGHTLADGPLPADLDAAKFFRMLDADYPDKTCFKTVQKYPIKVVAQDDSYVLFLCDPTRRWVLYEDSGKTIDRVDHPYARERKEVACAARP